MKAFVLDVIVLVAVATAPETATPMLPPPPIATEAAKVVDWISESDWASTRIAP